MAKYRSRLEIVADVLGVVSVGARKTQIMYQANLSYKLLINYLKDVIDMGLVKMKDENTYELTEKGFEFLEEFKGYYERRVEVEEQLNGVQDEKVMLENKFLNSRNMDVGSKIHLSRKSEKKKAT
jgi:predicted transcriptional regulator